MIEAEYKPSHGLLTVRNLSNPALVKCLIEGIEKAYCKFKGFESQETLGDVEDFEAVMRSKESGYKTFYWKINATPNDTEPEPVLPGTLLFAMHELADAMTADFEKEVTNELKQRAA